MSKLEELLQGVDVEWKALGDISEIYGGLKGKNKSDFTDGNAKYVTYKNIYNNIEVDLEALEMVKVSSNENQYEVKYGDVLFTGSSENASEAGISSAVTFNSEAKVFLNSFSFGLRFKSEIKILPEFSKYLFRSKSIRDEIIKTASGVTRYNVSKKRFVKIQIPIPPIEIQQEIVRVLDELTSLTNQLTTELETERQNRKKQFEFYREQLLSFEKGEAEWKSLGEILNRTKGTKITASQMKELDKENGSIKIFAGGKTVAFFDANDLPEKDINLKPSIIVKSRGIIEFEYYDKPFSHKNEMWSYHSTNDQIDIKYIYYFLKINELHFQNIGKRMQMPQISIPHTDKFKIPLISMEDQKRIVKLLDQFDATHTAIEEEITKEIKLRTQQYEYYREKLLSFPQN